LAKFFDTIANSLFLSLAWIGNVWPWRTIRLLS